MLAVNLATQTKSPIQLTANDLKVLEIFETRLLNHSFKESMDPLSKYHKFLALLPFHHNQPAGYVSLQFNVDPKVLQDLRSRSQGQAHGWFMECRLFSVNGPDIPWTDAMNPLCNNYRMPVPHFNPKKKKTNRGLVVTPPINLSARILTAQNNRFQFYRTPPTITDSGVAIVMLVHRKSVQELVCAIREQSGAPAEQLGPEGVPTTTLQQIFGSHAGDDDDDLMVLTTEIEVSLRCPLSFERISIPAKGRACKHFQCFDLQAYLEFSRQQNVWCCPCCARPTSLSCHDLVIDLVFEGLLKTVSDQIYQVKIANDGRVLTDMQTIPSGVQIKAEPKSEPDFKMAEPQLDFGILESKDSDAVPLGLCPNPCVTGSVAAAGLTVAVADVQSQGLGVVEAPAEDIGHDTFDRLNCEGFDALDDMVASILGTDAAGLITGSPMPAAPTNSMSALPADQLNSHLEAPAADLIVLSDED